MPARSDKIKQKRRRILFSFDFPDAEELYLGGDFNEWNFKKHPMKRDKKGHWEKIVMLYPGRYEYKAMVDDKWKLDPNNDWKCMNCYGTHNSIIMALQRE